MQNIVDIIKSKRGLISGDGVSESRIVEMEEALGLSFAPSYREYLLNFGIAAFGGHELTGITRSNHVNVLEVTKEEKLLNKEVPDDFYVIENAGIDGIIIWQSSSGEIYRTDMMSEPREIYDSLERYLLSC